MDNVYNINGDHDNIPDESRFESVVVMDNDSLRLKDAMRIKFALLSYECGNPDCSEPTHNAPMIEIEFYMTEEFGQEGDDPNPVVVRLPFPSSAALSLLDGQLALKVGENLLEFLTEHGFEV